MKTMDLVDACRHRACGASCACPPSRVLQADGSMQLGWTVMIVSLYSLLLGLFTKETSASYMTAITRIHRSEAVLSARLAPLHKSEEARVPRSAPPQGLRSNVRTPGRL